MSFLELAVRFRQWIAGEYAICIALILRGYARRLYHLYPLLLEGHHIAHNLW